VKLKILEQLQMHRAAKQPVALITDCNSGEQHLFYGLAAESAAERQLPYSPAILLEAERLLRLGASGLLAGAEASESLFLRSYVPRARLLIIGAVHIAQLLAPMAGLAGLDVTVIDPRRAFGNRQRFPGFELNNAEINKVELNNVELNNSWPDEALQELKPDAQCAVVTLSHDPKIDDPALLEALASQAFYIGALGSRRTHDKRLARLASQEVPASQLERINGPVGLALGGRAPAEIAVAILAQIIQARYKGK